MDKKRFHIKGINIDKLATDIETWLNKNAFIVESNKSALVYKIQAEKRYSKGSAVGANRIIKMFIKGELDCFIVEIDTRDWTRDFGCALLIGGTFLINNTILSICSRKIELEVWKFIKDWILLNSSNTDLYQVDDLRKGIEKEFGRNQNNIKNILLKKGIGKKFERISTFFNNILWRLLDKKCGKMKR